MQVHPQQPWQQQSWQQPQQYWQQPPPQQFWQQSPPQQFWQQPQQQSCQQPQQQSCQQPPPQQFWQQPQQQSCQQPSQQQFWQQQSCQQPQQQYWQQPPPHTMSPLYFKSYMASTQTAETHSLISSLFQTAVVPLETLQKNQQTPIKYHPDLSSGAKFTPVPQKGPEPVVEKEIPQLTGDSELQPSPPLQIKPLSSTRSLSQHQDDDPEMSPRLQLEVQQPPLLVDSQCQLAPPHLSPEEPIKSQQKRCLSPSRQGQELLSLSVDMAINSPSLFSDSSSSSSIPNTTEQLQEDGFISLSKSTSNFKNRHNLNLTITQCSAYSCLANDGCKEKCIRSTTAPPLLNDYASHQHWNTETNPLSISTSYESTLNRKPLSVISLLSSSSFTSDPHIHSGNSNSKSEIEITNSSPKHPTEGMDTSDDAYATSEGNCLKNDSSAEVKDSGFFSVEELTPKKSPNSDLGYLLSNVKKISNVARPCSVLLEKTPDTLVVPSLRFPLQRAVDQQNTFSVKRVDNNEMTSPNSRAKPRLLKRLSDNQKTFRLDYIHGHGGGRKNLSSRLWAGKTRSIKQNYRFK